MIFFVSVHKNVDILLHLVRTTRFTNQVLSKSNDWKLK